MNNNRRYCALASSLFFIGAMSSERSSTPPSVEYLSEGHKETLSFDYKNDTFMSFELRRTNGVQMRIRTTSPSVAEVFFVDGAGNAVPVPDGITITDNTHTTSTIYGPPKLAYSHPVILAKKDDMRIFLAASDAYSIFFRGKLVATLQPVKAWTVRALQSQPMEVHQTEIH